jgi:hypothetical protein
MPGGVPPAAVLAALDRPADARLARLQELFSEGGTPTRAQVEHALEPVLIAPLMDARVLEMDSHGVRSRLISTRWVTSSSPATASGAIRRASRGCLPAGTAVAYTKIRRQIRAALDVGTGSGVQALLAAKHAKRVVGTDIKRHMRCRSPR